MQVLYKLAPSWEGAWAGFGPARQAGRAQRPVFEKMCLVIIGVAMAPFLESRMATRVSRQCGSRPGGQEIQESTMRPKKNTPRDTETTGQRPKFRKKGGFLTELGIDRLHPEPKNDFLGPGSPKNP